MANPATDRRLPIFSGVDWLFGLLEQFRYIQSAACRAFTTALWKIQLCHLSVSYPCNGGFWPRIREMGRTAGLVGSARDSLRRVGIDRNADRGMVFVAPHRASLPPA